MKACISVKTIGFVLLALLLLSLFFKKDIQSVVNTNTQCS